MAEPNYYDEPETEEKPVDEGNSPVTEIPKSLAMGKDFKVGDEIVLKIDAVRENSFVVSYAPAKPGEEEGGEEGAEAGQEEEPGMAMAGEEEPGMGGGGGGMYD